AHTSSMKIPMKVLRRFGIPLVTVLSAAGVFLAGLYIGYENRSPILRAAGVTNKESGVSDEADFAPFWKAWQIISEKFPGAEKVTDQERVYGAIDGLVGSLKDPYSVFFDPQENKEFNEEIAGEFFGIGVEIGKKDNILTVIAPIKGTPAYRAGLLAGDKIIKVGKTFTADLTIDEAIALIRGESGTTVDLTIVREGFKEPKVYTVAREKIIMPTVDTERREKEKVFIIHLYNFSAQSPTLFAKALQEFARSGDTRLVLDLRNNPGGYLEASVSMANWFLPEGKVVVKEIGKDPSDVTYHRSKGPGVFAGKIKMAILVNGGSASASEILAGALTEQGVATLIGEKSFGKGSVQELIKLTKDTSLKLTIAKWYTPNGVSISDQGLMPSMVVSQVKDDANVDEQLEAAVKFVAGK
ncbi:MAG TPA: S41 family peptidase, partial [Candidatus Paceibacterota bacterium]|nr:S41 family peptidase [Candidatus Paceibacterota bacterium]